MVFPGRIPGEPVNIENHWQKALKTAGIENFRFHDLRHSAASYLAMNGATLARNRGRTGAQVFADGRAIRSPERGPHGKRGRTNECENFWLKGFPFSGSLPNKKAV
jgi:hypothetical protein